MTDIIATNAKGIEFKVGEAVKVKGSKVERKIADIYFKESGIEIRATRTDGKDQSFSAYVGIDRIVHI